MILFGLVATLVLGSATDFKMAFPGATVVESPGTGRLTSASGFSAAGLGATAEAAARTFLARHGSTFGVAANQRLLTKAIPVPGQPGPVRFERRIAGLPVFDGDVVVGVDGTNNVILVNGSNVPPIVKGRHRISRRSAIRVARAGLPGLETTDTPRAERGWRALGRVIRPVWRVKFVAARPAGDWCTYVDAETGKVVFRINLRSNMGL